MTTKSFANIIEVTPDATAQWKDSLFLTIDLDWACDDVLTDTIDLVEKADVSATWFVTHETPLLQRLRENPMFELGIHPNFNFLFNGDGENGVTADEVIDRLLTIVPEAKTIRCHSLTQNTKLFDLFVNKGLTHDCNNFIPYQAGIELKPWRLWNELITIPHFWEDDMACIYAHKTPIQELSERPGLKVFDFHPIHVFLNTEHIERYDRTRAFHLNSEKLINHRYPGDGTRSSLETLLSLR